MALDWLALPEELLLYLLHFVSLDDAASLSEVCTVFAALSRTHTYWLSSLAYTSTYTRLACPYHTDLATLDLPALKALAAHTLRRERNWNRPAPRIFHRGDPNDSATDLGPGETLLFIVPGTHLVATHYRTGLLTCWSAADHGRTRATLAVPRVDDVSGGWEERGRFTVALLARTPNPALFVISVEYSGTGEAGADLRMALRLRWDGSPQHVHCAPFISADVAGVLRAPPGAAAELVAVNITSPAAAAVVVPTPLRIGDGHITACAHGGDVHFLATARADAAVFCCPRAHLPHAGRLPAPSPAPAAPSARTVALGLDRRSTGVPCPGAGPATAHAHAAGLAVRFWRAGGAGAPAVLPGAALPGARPVLAAGQSGRSVVAVLRGAGTGTGAGALWLVRAHGAEGASVHLLEAPAGVEWAAVVGVRVDECRGVVYLLEEGGLLHIVAYA